MSHVLAQDLRNAVLQAAFEGRLTNREKTDSNIDVALKRNSSTRNNKIAEKEIKKDSILPIDETPFEVPDEWTWVRFNEIFSVLNGDRGKNYPAKNTLKKTGSIPFISALNLNGKDVTVDDNLLYLSEEQYEKLNAGKLKTNDTVMCIRGSLGKHGKFQFEKGAIASSLVIIRHISNICDDKYLFYYLDSPLLTTEIRKYDNGTAQPNLAADSLKKFLFPLPPIEEQARIVARVDELMAKINEYEKIEKELTELQKAFPGNMKDAILQAAMQGKLTEQLDSDSKTNQLYSENCFDDDLPFDIPDNWTWTTLNSLIKKDNIGDGDWVLSNDMCAQSNNNLVQIGSVGDGRYIDKDFKHVSDEFFDAKNCSELFKEDILVSRFISKEHMNVCILPDLPGRLFTAVDVCWIRNDPDRYSNKWLMWCLLSQGVQRQVMLYTAGTTRQRVSKTNLMKVHIPLPPIEEQQRIVDKLDQLLPLCDSLEAMI